LGHQGITTDVAATRGGTVGTVPPLVVHWHGFEQASDLVPGLYFGFKAMKTTLIYTLGAFLLGACSEGRPVTVQTPAPVGWSLAPLSAPIQSGDTANVRVDASIQDGWHIYSITQPAGGPIATRITVPVGQPFVAAGDPKPTAQPRIAFDDAFKMNVQLHEKAVGFMVPVRATAAATNAADSVHVNVRYQVCNESLCLPPQTAKLVTPAMVETR
jgi:DsbC/DsbD-like thiol-disulfide interchange protein